MTAQAVRPSGAGPVQASFDELGTPLRDVTFVVVDLETTGGSPADAEITEIGAVKVRAGEMLGEFQTLVRPRAAIPPFIAVLTGITDAMVAAAPPIAGVLPTFFEFARGAVLVAHNAPFDVGFLRANADRLGLPWPGFTVVDTARLARRALTRDEAPNCRLASLARLFRTTTEPCHRALADARATVDVLHGLLERVGSLGVQSLEELCAFSQRVPEQVRRKRTLADGLPSGPGVYVFRDGAGRPLYVGKATDLRSRVRSYFTAAETRRRMAEMVVIAERVDAVPCATLLEAEVRELRAIRTLEPRYNRRSRRPRGEVWLRLTTERFPRLSVGRNEAPVSLGPFASRRGAEVVLAALQDAVPLRQCTVRIPARTPPSGTACTLAQIGRCGAPCDGTESADAYAVHVRRLALAVAGDPGDVVAALVARVERLAAQERFEEAAVQRDRVAAVVRAIHRRQRLLGLTRLDELVAARPRDGGWDVAVVRKGRLAATTVAPRGHDPYPYVDAARRTADATDGAASAEETEIVLRWLEAGGTRLVAVTGAWSCPAFGAGRLRSWLAVPDRPADPFSDRRGLRPVGPA
ncbi:MAG TPA: DEDD exonuclease domain-containing protein [Mycobacteriales bacterium]